MGHSFDMLTFDFLLKLPQPVTGLFFPTTSLKRLRAARIDLLADSNEPAINSCMAWHG